MRCLPAGPRYAGVLVLTLGAVWLGASLASPRRATCCVPPALGETDFTLTAWIRTTAGGVVFSLSSDGGVWAGGGKAFVVRDGKMACDWANVGIFVGNTGVADGEWHQLAWSYSHAGEALTLFVDGRADGTFRARSLPDNPGDVFRIGMAAPGITAPNGFTGDIDEVRWYAGAWEPGSPELGRTANLLGWWPLDGDGAETTGRFHAGLVHGAAAVPGRVGQCLRFDGNSAVEIVDPHVRLLERIRYVNPSGLVHAVAEIARRCGTRYPHADDRLREAQTYAEAYPRIVAGLEAHDDSAAALGRRLLEYQRKALLEDPDLDFDRILLVRRGLSHLGLPANWESNSSLPLSGFDNDIAILSDWRGVTPHLETVYHPSGGRFVGDVDLHFDGTKALFSMPGSNGRWQVHEIELDGATAKRVRELNLITEPDVDNYDACYLPDGAIVFSSTAPFVGVPCVTGASHVSNLYRREPDGGIRRLTFEQDHDWCPTVMDDGRVMYLRWEYADIPHFVSRILFTMNPDGTNQMAFYGSNSYWPNSMFYARPLPGSRSKFVAVVSGHHDTQRMGELVVFDAARGTHEADGALQRVPGRGKRVEPVILDALVRDRWPKYLHPWPLDEHRFLVAAQLTPSGRWGLYLADTFDNLVPIHEVPGSALLEPIPLRPRPTPPVIPSRVVPGSRDATVLLADVYAGPGLAGVPRGVVKKLRVFTYQFAYHGVGGQVYRVGFDGPWDIRRILGTVPVYPDGSAHFRIPANTPIAIQPLDERGRALQLMRSWMTAMPGERLACAGCHEPANSAAPNTNAIAYRRPPDQIEPWYGPVRGFSFRREVQPVLDRHCVRCHGAGASLDLRDGPDVHPAGRDPTYNSGSHFPPSYLALRRYVRGHTIESDMHLLVPGEFHASTTRLVQLLENGHYGVRLDAEAWDRINTWIDLNTPAHGTWGEIVGRDYVAHQRRRRIEMDRRYAGLTVDAEEPLGGRPYGSAAPSSTAQGVSARPLPQRGSQRSSPARTTVSGASNVMRRRGAVRPAFHAAADRVDLGGGIFLELVRIPAGSEISGPRRGVAKDRSGAGLIARPFWMGRFEITNAQYRRFDPNHDSGIEVGDFLQFSDQERGYPVNRPDQPVCRVSWYRANAFCRWLSRKTGRAFRLPTDAEWEYACRAGTSTDMWYGKATDRFDRYENLADASLFRIDTYDPWLLPSGAIHPWRPAVASVNDGHRVSAPVGQYLPNPWGLYDIHGNVAEWTRTLSSAPGGGRRDGSATLPAFGCMVVRGGSWNDLPREATASSRRAYPPWMRVFDVGFRVVCETP